MVNNVETLLSSGLSTAVISKSHYSYCATEALKIELHIIINNHSKKKYVTQYQIRIKKY